MQLVETHAHLDFKDFDEDREEVIKRARQAGVFKIINIGATLEGSKKGVELAKKYDDVYAAIGIHPEDADKLTDETLDLFREMSKEDKVVAIGEIGLDYYVQIFPPDKQKEIFKKQLDLAIELNLPVVLHIRNAFEDVMEIIKDYDWHKNKAVMHCYLSSYKKIKQVLDLGLMVSFTGIVTYDLGIQKAVEVAPLEKMMLETDCPFLAPEPYRGGRAEPAHVLEIAKKIAEIKNTSLEEVAKITTQNAVEFFNLK